MHPISTNTFNDCNQLKICTALPISRMVRTRHKILLTRFFLPASPLTALLIHVVYILHWDVIFLNNLKKEVEMLSNNWAVECLATLWVQARWLSKLNLGPVLEEPVDPVGRWLPTTKILSLLLDSMLAERVCSIREKDNPVNKHLLCLG